MLAQMAVEAGLLNTVPTNPVMEPHFSTRTTPADGLVPEPTPWKNMAIRMGGGVIGGLAGIPLGPVGIASGAALGTSIASNEIAQPREVQQGTRESVNPLAGYAEGAASMLPMSQLRGLASLPRVAGSATAGAGVGSVGVQLAETGTVDPMRTLQETAAGGLLGTVLPVGVAGARQLPRLATRVAQSPAVQHLATSEAGAVGPMQPKMLPSAPDAAPGGMLVKEPPTAPVVPEAADGQWSRVAGERLPAGAMGLIDDVEVPASMTPKGLQPASLKANTERTLRFFDRHVASPESKQIAVDILTRGEDHLYQVQRRSGQTWEQLDALASQIIPEVRLPKGSIVSPEETAALRRAAFGLLDRANEVSGDVQGLGAIEAKVAAGMPDGVASRDALLQKYGVSDVGQLRLLEKEAVEEAVAAQRSLMGVRSEFGRGLNYLKSLQKARNMGDADFLQQALKGGAVPEEAMAALRQMPDQMGRYKFLRGLSKPNAQDYWRWYAMTSYLSGPVTQWRNLMGNATNFGVEAVLVNPIAAGIDAVRNPGNRQVHLKESQAAAAGLSSGFMDGVGKALFYFKNGFTSDDVAGNAELPPEVFGGALAPNVVGRTMGAVDQFFRTVGFHMELHRQATTQAVKEGLQGDALSQRVSQLVADPTVTPELHKRALRYATELTYQERNEKIGTTKLVRGGKTVVAGLDDLTKRGADFAWDHMGLSKAGKMGGATYGLLSFPPSVIVAPFINTPFNILKRAGQYAGGLPMAAKGGDRDAMLNAARGAVGMASLATAAGLYQQGLITGAAPTEGAEADAFYATKRPYSVKIGDQWVSYQALGPLGAVLGAVTNYMQAAEANPKDALGKFGQMAGATGKMVVDSTFLKGMYNILDAVANAERSGDKWAARTATGLLPAAGAMRFVRDQIDPTLRNPDGMSEQVQAALPGLSDNVAPRVDYTGNEIQRPSSIAPTTAKEDPLRQELMRLKKATGEGYLRAPESAATGLLRKINTELKQRQRPSIASVPRPLLISYAKAYGQESERVLTNLTRDPNYAKLPDDKRSELIEEFKRRITKRLDARFLGQYMESAP